MVTMMVTPEETMEVVITELGLITVVVVTMAEVILEEAMIMEVETLVVVAAEISAEAILVVVVISAAVVIGKFWKIENQHFITIIKKSLNQLF